MNDTGICTLKNTEKVRNEYVEVRTENTEKCLMKNIEKVRHE
jgi:hypothetical protein